MIDQYVFDLKTKHLTTGGDSPPCPPGGLGKLLFEKMKHNADEGFIAQIDAETGDKDTFKDLLIRSIKLSIYMQKSGILPGDIILFYDVNCLDSITIFLASLFTGVVYSAIDPSLHSEQSIAMQEMIEAKIIFVSETNLHNIHKPACLVNQTKVIVIGNNAKYTKHQYLDQIFKSLDITDEELQSFQPKFIDDVTKTVMLLLTSGSMGLPKATSVNHNYLHTSTYNSDHAPKQLLLYYFGNPFWCSCIQVYIAVCYSGFKKLNSKTYSGIILWDLVDKYQVNALYLGYNLVIDAIDCLVKPQPSIATFFTTGAQLTVQKQLQAAKMLPNAVFGFPYGITEIGNVSWNYDPQCGSVGKPTHNNQIIKIVDPLTEQALDLGEIGEIRVKSKYPMNGYYKSNSSDCFDEDGFFKTGDLGYLNADFELFVEGRLGQTFKCEGTFVIPKIIETHLETHPDVQQCVVIGVRVKNSQIVVELQTLAIVVLKPGCSVTTEELLKFSNDKMDSYHQLRAGVKIVDKSYIPYTLTGKINRNLLQNKMKDLS